MPSFVNLPLLVLEIIDMLHYILNDPRIYSTVLFLQDLLTLEEPRPLASILKVSSCTSIVNASIYSVLVDCAARNPPACLLCVRLISKFMCKHVTTNR